MPDRIPLPDENDPLAANAAEAMRLARERDEFLTESSTGAFHGKHAPLPSTIRIVRTDEDGNQYSNEGPVF
jgi:hypothetical protein